MAAAKVNPMLYSPAPGEKEVDIPIPPGDEGVTVNLEDDEEPPEDEEDDDSAAAQPPHPGRRERRSNRYKEANDRAERAEREAEASRIRAEQAERRAAAFEAQALTSNRQPPPTQDDRQADYKRRRDALIAKQQRIQEQFLAIPEEAREERRAEFQSELNDITDELSDLQASRRGPPVDVSRALEQAKNDLFKSQHSDVFGNPKAEALLSSIWQRATGYDGKPKTQETVLECLDQVRKEMGIGGQRRTEGEKSRFSGMSSRGNGGSQSRAKPAKQMVLTRPMREMARARYPHLPAEKAYKTWAMDMQKEE